MTYGPYERTLAFSFHEAGHGVVGHACGGVVKSVSIGKHGNAEICWPTPDTDGEMKCLWAGITAEQTYENNCDPRALDTDSWSGWALDDAEINGICHRRLGSDTNAAGDLRLQVLEEARKVLATNWKVVEKLAAMLSDITVVDGDSLVQILSEVQQIPPVIEDTM